MNNHKLFKLGNEKHMLAPWIISHFPENYEEMIYIEPFAGTASVLLKKNPSKEEIISDHNSGIIKLFRIVRDASQELIDFIKKFDFALSSQYESNDLKMAIKEIVLNHVGKNGKVKLETKNVN